MACNCIDELNADMRAAGTGSHVGTAVLATDTFATRAVQITVYLDGKMAKISTKAEAVPAFCPFCGTRYIPLGAPGDLTTNHETKES